MIEYIRSLKWADIVISVLIEQRKIFIVLSEMKRELPPATFVFPVLAALFDITALSFLSQQTLLYFYKTTYGFAALSLIYVLLVFFAAAIIDIFFQFAGFSGKIKQTIAAINVSLIPRYFLLPVVIIAKVSGAVPIVIYVAANIALTTWSFVALVRTLSDMHSTSFAKSTASIIVPMLVIVAIFSLIIVSGVVILIKMISFL